MWFVYRFFETIPALLAWLTIVAMFVFSWLLPAWVAVFIILFDIYWLLKTIFLSLHLSHSFRILKANLKVDWLFRLKNLHPQSNRPAWHDIYHLVIIPFYQEPYDVIRNGLESIRSTNYPNDKIIVVVGGEERAGKEAEAKLSRLASEYQNVFGHFLTTVHPAGLEGELAGKGANITWMSRAAKKEIIDPLGLDYQKILVSALDVDTVVYPEYFGVLTHAFLTVPDPLHASFQPVPLYINNIYDSPSLARVVSFSASFWQLMQQARPERLTTFSSHAVPFQALVDVDFWETDLVSEDSRIFWQLFLHYDGAWRVEPLNYPVAMDTAAAPTFWQSMINIYKQQRRWGWGVENTPYLLDGFRRNSRISWWKKIYWIFIDLEGRHSWSTNAILLFALGWLPLFLGGEHFNYTLLSYSLPEVTRFIMMLAMVGVISSTIFSIALLPPKPDWFRWYHYFLYVLQWVLLPVTLIIFGSIPGLDAQTRLALGGRFRLGFWVTPKYR